MKIGNRSDSIRRGEAGSGVLTVVAALGLILLLIQGSTFYRARGSAKFLGSEKSKVMALQMAEAGVEENIADLAKGTVVPTAGTSNLVTYDHKGLVGGNYTSKLSTVAMGAGSSPDTVDLTSTGAVGTIQQTIQARLRLNKYSATTTTTPADPTTMPPVTSTPEYAACVDPSCRVCHLPNSPSPVGGMVNTQSKLSMVSHNSHVGDYITTNGTCDRYAAITSTANSVKVQILSWR
ncbi:MAG: hypothetical protein ABIW76_05055 [Fibrobacteria bacterium]